MADNFEKTLAIVAKEAGSTSNSIKLGDVTINELLNLYGAINDPLAVYGSSIPAVAPVLQGKGASATYFKNTIRDLLTGDAVYSAQSNAAQADPATIYINSHAGNQEELTVAEVNVQGLANWLSVKLTNYLPQAMKHKARTGFATLVQNAETLDITEKAATESERDFAIRVLKTLVERVLLMTKAIDNDQGIDQLTVEQFVITAGPKMLAAVTAAGLAGNMTQKVFSDGIINELNWGGVRIQFANYLPAGTDAFIGATFLGKSPLIPTAMYAGPKDLNGIMYEARAAFLLPGTDKASSTGFEFLYKDKVATPGTVDFDKDAVLRTAVKLVPVTTKP